MPDGLAMLGQAFASLLTPWSLALAAAASLGGIVIGALPGLTATMGLALVTTVTIHMSQTHAILVLMCTYAAAIYGGSRSAILLNIPGTPSNAATCLDGYQLARRGLAGQAMGIATLGSAFGALVGLVLLALITPPLGELALRFGAQEFFWLAAFGVVISGNLSGTDPVKGWIAGCVGLIAAMVGREGTYGYDRFTFGSTDLAAGLSLLPAMVGAFGFAEVLIVMRQTGSGVVTDISDRVIPRLRDIARYWVTAIRSGVIGTVMGIIPGVGEDVGAWGSYAAAKKLSREPEAFGRGSVEGLLAAETGNNAAVPGAIVPVLTLGVPGSGPAAIMLAAMIIHGARPGPLIMIESPQFVYDVIAMMAVAIVGILVFGLGLTRLMVLVLRARNSYLMPVIAVLCIVGPYAIQSRLFDVWIVVGFGILGFVMRSLNYPMAPLVLGIVLGELLDRNLRRALVLTDGDPTPFFTRPISLVLAIVVLGTLASQVPAVRRLAARAAGGVRARLAPRSGDAG